MLIPVEAPTPAEAEGGGFRSPPSLAVTWCFHKGAFEVTSSSTADPTFRKADLVDPHDAPQQPGPEDAKLPEVTISDGSPRGRRPEPPGGWQTSNLLALVNGVILAVGGVFVTTSSVVITVIASVVALLIALMIVLKS
ncbi:hypothetical protein ABZ897_41570 [Nonomuraea sp. NPDC046802]|uniref:hypothetical protein n=1 Tax=Nonomuraea sp. NPDC046802 TaxID=3154919 RepID=UPI0033EF3D0B